MASTSTAIAGTASTLDLWVGRRASNKQVAPDKLDNIVAGGIGNGHGAAGDLAEGSRGRSVDPAER